MEQSIGSCTTAETRHMQFCRAYLLAGKKEYSCIFGRVHRRALTDGVTHGIQSSKNDYGNGDEDCRKHNKHTRSDITSSVLTPGKSRYNLTNLYSQQISLTFLNRCNNNINNNNNVDVMELGQLLTHTGHTHSEVFSMTCLVPSDFSSVVFYYPG